jgi:hypothetical protein
MVPIETIGLAREEELTEWATEKCDCTRAVDYVKRKHSVEKAKERIEQLFIQGRAGEAVVNLLNMGLEAIVNDQIDEISIDLGNGCKSKVSQNSKGNIKVERTDTRKVKYEQ